MLDMKEFFTALGEEVLDADEETFDLFSLSASLPNLGMVDGIKEVLELSIAGRDFSITQSPGILQSTREGGTTGAAVWQTSVHLTEWMSSSTNALFEHGVLDASSTALELGSGISGLVPCALGTFVRRVVATDQQYLLRLLRANIDANTVALPARTAKRTKNRQSKGPEPKTSIELLALDWETDDIPNLLQTSGMKDGVDVVVACDCIFNYALITPFVQACADVCRLRQGGDKVPSSSAVTPPTVCLIAQQLRQPEVFEQWLRATMEAFRIWRLPDELLTDQLKEGSGFALHVAVLR